MEYFKTVYSENLWKNQESISGDGSTLNCSLEYLKFIEKFIVDNRIKKILDIGCGDFNLMRHLNLSYIEYVGIDMIKDLIDINNKKYGNHNINFFNVKIHEFDYADKYDLILCKDVLQHWSNQSVINFHRSLKNYNYCILVNDYINHDYTNKNYNVNILDSEYTVVDLMEDSYNFRGDYIFEWKSCNSLKKCFLLNK